MRFKQLLHAVAALSPARFVLWAPLWLMIGIGWYFALASEPSDFKAVRLLTGATFLLLLTWRFPVRWLALAFFLVALGFTAAKIRTHVVQTPLLIYELHNKTVEGTIDEIDPVEKKTKLVFSDISISGVKPEWTPRRMRISFRGSDDTWQIGDRLRFTATLYPLPSPNLPDGYDFARFFYFHSIGGDGFAIRAPEKIESAAQSGISAWLGNVRRAIGNDMRGAMPGAVGAVAAAMTVGETGPIPEDDKNLLRDAGLAHMLAIAGLHLGIVAGIVFFAARLLLALWSAFAMRFSAKKWAAGLALGTAFIYLCLAGFPIPAERAFIMVLFLFGAMLLDRRGLTLRTLALAAIFILLVFPESMLSASFQMSFGATLAIVAMFERFGATLHARASGWGQSLWRHAFGIALTSLAATLATSPFVLYHFNRFAVFGLIANMVVVPLATFVIMPGIVLSLLLMPFGLQAIGYFPLSLGVEWMLRLASWVTNLPYASIRLLPPSTPGLVCAAFGLMWLCLTPSRVRLLGFALIALGLATIAFAKPYDVLVSDDGKKVALRQDDGTFVFARGRPTSFDAEVWLRYHGQESGLKLSELNPPADCDEERCIFMTHGLRMVVARRNDTEELCAKPADIIISSEVLLEPACQGVPWLIDKRFLWQHGVTGIRFTDHGAEVTSVLATRARRPWVPKPHSELYAPANSDIHYPDEP